MAKSKDQKVDVFGLRLSPNERKDWQEAADKSRRTLSQWIRDCCNAQLAVKK
jgi:hypothetical protein